MDDNYIKRATANEQPDLESGLANDMPNGLSDEEADDRALMEQFLRSPAHDYRNLQYGDTVDGTIMRVDRDEILVDIGSKAEGVVPTREMQSIPPEDRAALKPGDVLLVFVVQSEDKEGRAVLSIDKARQEKSWRRLQRSFENNEVIEAKVINYNKGGLLVNSGEYICPSRRLINLQSGRNRCCKSPPRKRAFNHPYIGTEHILLDLICEGEGVAARVLDDLGVKLSQARHVVEFIVGMGEGPPKLDQDLTARAKKVIAYAVDEAKRLNHHYIGTEHLLLG